MVLYSSSPLAEIIRASQTGIKYEDYELNWWSADKTFYKHNALLLNAYHQKNLNRENMHIPNDVKIICDSGGFELLSRRAKGLPCKIEALDVLRWQESIGNIGLTLDLSPVNLQSTGENGKSVATTPQPISHEEFQKRLEETCHNNDIFQSNRSSSTPYGLKIYNVIHSGMGKIESIDEWYERVKDFKFEGWSIAPKPPSDPVKVVIDAMFLWDRGKRENLHVLGISGIKVLPALVYLEKHIKNISTDSFSYGVNAIVRKHMNLHGPDFFFKPKEPIYKKVPCKCPVCANIKTVNDLYRTDIPGYALIALHNEWIYLNYLQYLEALVDDELLFRKFCSKHETLSKALYFIDYTIEHGWDEAITKAGLKQSSLDAW